MENLETILTRWTDAEEIRLRAGEIDPDTMRTVLAVANGMAGEVRLAFKETEDQLGRALGALGGADAELNRLKRVLDENESGTF